MLTVTLYTRQNCHLCEQTKADLRALQTKFPHKVVEIDVDIDARLQSEYGAHLPVVQVGPYTRKAPITSRDLAITLGAASDRVHQLEKVAHPTYLKQKARSIHISRWDVMTMWLTRHYLLVLNLLVLLYVGLPFLAPVLMKSGAEAPARLIYRSYGFVCHQLAFRSWFLLGGQPVYPRETAGVAGLVPFGSATGLSEVNEPAALFTARNFVGNEQLGYKVAFCERDVAIYAAILLFGLVYGLSRRKLPPLPWYLWIIIGMGPIALDGVSQLLSQSPFSLLTFRESTPFLRTLTGGLFGFMTAWFGYPLIDETMQDTRRFLVVKFKRLDKEV